MKKRKTIIITTTCLFMVWFLPYVKNETLTWLHGDEFIGLQKSTNMIGDVDYLKVLAYSTDFARVYYFDNEGGDILGFERSNGQWKRALWNTVWSKMGSADDYIWPYFYHSPEGWIVFFVAVVLISITVCVFSFVMKIIQYLSVNQKSIKRNKNTL